MKQDPRLHFYDADTRELRFEQRSAAVPRVGDKVRFPSNRLVVVVDLEWSWPQPGSVDFQNQEGPWIDITFRDAEA